MKIVSSLLVFFLGSGVTAWVGYNMLYSSLIYSQLNSSLLLLERLEKEDIKHIKDSLVKVYIPTELCAVKDFKQNVLSLNINYIDDVNKRAEDILPNYPCNN